MVEDVSPMDGLHTDKSFGTERDDEFSKELEIIEI
jgi:hypothetical protein